MRLQAVIFVPDLVDVERWVLACHEHCDAHGYQVTGLVVGDWGEVVRYTCEGQAQVIVVGDRGYLPPDRIPRVEVAGHGRIRLTRRRPEFTR